MKIGIIGPAGHGKSTLVQALMSMQGKNIIEPIELKTKDLLKLGETKQL